MPMSDPVLAAIITATATICMSLLQLRFSLNRSLAKDAGGRVQAGGAKRKGRGPFAVLFVIIIASAVGGFALSQWLTENERVSQNMLQRELQDRVDQITRTANQLEQTRAGVRAEIETGVLRKIGSDGVVVMATVAPCRPSLVVNPPGAATPPGVTAETAQSAAPACTESEASPVTLCATIPAGATITEVELYTRLAQSDAPWSTSRVIAGQESGQARFAEKYAEAPEAPGTKQVCEGFAHWSTDHARIARMVIRYGI
jgi:hypothetical protein